MSVVVPMYNAADYVEETLAALLDQTLPDLEVVVVDDGSTDGSTDLVLGFGDPRVRVVPGARTGEGGARNRGIDAAEGEYVAWNDADDVSLPHRLERMVAAMDDGVDYVHHDMFLVDSCGRQVGYQRSDQLAPDRVLPHFLRDGFGVNNNSAMLRRSAIGDLRHAEHFKIGVDSDFMRRFAPHHRGVHLPEGLLLYRRHSRSALATMDPADEYAQLRRLLELEDPRALLPDAFQDRDWPDDGHVVAQAHTGLLLVRRQLAPQGATHLEQALATPTSSPAAHGVVRVLVDLASGQAVAALHALAALPDNAMTSVLTGDTLAGLGALEEAATAYRRALHHNPRSYDATTGLRALGAALGTDDLGACRERLVPPPSRAARLLAAHR